MHTYECSRIVKGSCGMRVWTRCVGDDNFEGLRTKKRNLSATQVHLEN